MNKAATLDMTEGKVIRVLLVFTIPIFISNLFQQFYNVVDVAVIGHILGDNALAAVGATSSIYSLVIGFINGMSNGFCIIIARYFGGNEQDNFQKSVQFSIILSIITTVILTIASILFLKLRAIFQLSCCFAVLLLHTIFCLQYSGQLEIVIFHCMH